jgi:hypothetical protein
MQSRLERRLRGDSDIAVLFTQFSAVKDPISLFDDVPRLKEEIARFIDLKVQEAKKQATREVLVQLKKQASKEIDGYMRLVTKIVDITIKIANEHKKNNDKFDLKILEARTNFDFLHKEIKLLFIVDSDIDSETNFSEILNIMESTVLEKENYLSDILYINSRGSELDTGSIDKDFPSIWKMEQK